MNDLTQQKLNEQRTVFWTKLMAAVRDAGLTVAREVVNDSLSFAEIKSPECPSWVIHLQVERNGWKSSVNRLLVGTFRNKERFTRLDDERITLTIADLKLRVKYAVQNAEFAAKSADERKSWATIKEQQMAGTEMIPGITLKIEDCGTTAGDYYLEFAAYHNHPFNHMNADQVKALYAFIEANFKLHPFRVGKRVKVKGHAGTDNSEYEEGVVTEAETGRITVKLDSTGELANVYSLNTTILL